MTTPLVQTNLIERLRTEAGWFKPGGPTPPTRAPDRHALLMEAACVIERLCELADKFKWQVRDTCVRAEAAEALAGREGGEDYRTLYGTVIKALAAIVNVHTPDKLFDLDAIPRDPVMEQVTRIRSALDRYTPSRAGGGEVGEELSESDKDVAVAQAVEFAEYVERQAKGEMVKAARKFLSLPYAQEIASRLDALHGAGSRGGENG